MNNLLILDGDIKAEIKIYNPEIDQSKTEFMSGMNIKELTEIHRRTQGAIRSRLKKEDLIDES